ncbi:NAD(P)/FAD-dependent oxidoreductase [Alistipes sp. ZOR0009]|uniref:NAD(P)/FAD-dependent oxidoreductase n=1 Tax=Alistipes sp. ZOR0009 TaxID=1339253 RepID=UPI000647B055|nr:NAD(P)/FAD-dependent oxidoreductase [Alistipes sp. ZOR0009]
MTSNNSHPVVVIVGAGFGGVELAKKLIGKPFSVLIIDKHNYHNFQPLMYQVATGGLGPDSIAFPIRRIFRKARNVKFRVAEVHSVKADEKKLETSIGDIPYDYLVIATGSTTNFFGFDRIKENLLSLKSIPEALDMRSTIIQNIERAANKTDQKGAPQPINIVIIGGGPAGVELAGALAEMRKYVLPKDFPELDFERMKIYLIEAAPKLLAFMSEAGSAKTYEYLEQLGVIVKVNSKVMDYDGAHVTIEDGSIVDTQTVIWTAGVKGATIDGIPTDVLLPNGRIKTDEFNRVPGTERIFAIGDVAACITEANPRGDAMLAPVAMQQGHLLAANLVRETKGEAPIPFVYKNKGVMATIGRRRAVVDLPNIRFQGAFAWYVWMFVHIMSLVGFRNKVITLVDWMINYVNYDRPLGLMIRPARKIRKVIPNENEQ